MKQCTFVIECIISDGTPLYLIRDPRNGLCVRQCIGSAEVADFLFDAEAKLVSASEDSVRIAGSSSKVSL